MSVLAPTPPDRMVDSSAKKETPVGLLAPIERYLSNSREFWRWLLDRWAAPPYVDRIRGAGCRWPAALFATSMDTASSS